MACVYILYSKNLEKFYIGSCLNLETRLEDHRCRKFPTCFTAKDNSWVSFFDIAELEYEQARTIEVHIKKMKSSTYISNLKKYPEIVAKLKEKYAKLA